MASLLSPTREAVAKVEALARDGVNPTTRSVLLVGDADDPTIEGFARYAGHDPERKIVRVSPAGLSQRTHINHQKDTAPAAAVVFLNRRPSEAGQAALDDVADLVANRQVNRVCLVSSYLMHLGDKAASEAEEQALHRLRASAVPTAVIRPSVVLSPSSRATAWLRSWAFCYPLVPNHLIGCCVDAGELFAAIEDQVSQSVSAKSGIYTLLGANRPWRSRLREHLGGGLLSRSLVLLAGALGLFGVGWIVSLLLSAGARWLPRLRAWRLGTLYPQSPKELRALFNKYNYRHVKVVGYNNGVVHFGWKYPGKTIVSTIRCNRVARIKDNIATFDAGVTLRTAIDLLKQAGKEFYVLPNYSFVSVGTPFFIPIHGSASEYSTLGETIEKVLLYDAGKDRLISVSRGDAGFGEYVYNLESDVLLLRLRFRVKDKSRYYLRKSQWENPSAAEILSVLRDASACNVEVRKGRAADGSVAVYQYFIDGQTETNALEFPKDSLGKVWDRIEANQILSWLFHALMKRFGYHVELFFTSEEFAVFWQTHQSLPIAKIQLRSIKRNGFPHSPFREHDCISADLFMLRKHKHAFEEYIKETFRAVQCNPGKHSM